MQISPVKVPVSPNIKASALVGTNAVTRPFFCGDESGKMPKSWFESFTDKVKLLWAKFKQALKDFYNKIFSSSPKATKGISTAPTKPNHEQSRSNSVSVEAVEDEVDNPLRESTQANVNRIPYSSASSPRPVTVGNTNALADNKRLQRGNDALLDRDLDLAKKSFERRLKQRNTTPAERKDNALRYSTDVFDAFIKHLEKSTSEVPLPLLKDVQHISNELKALSPVVEKTELFKDLPEATQTRMIALIQFALKHTEPRLNETGQELAQSLGISESTINRLRQE